MIKPVSNIVFSMNRPLQLEAYLESLYRHMPGDKIQTYIIYKANLFNEQYSELFRRYSDCIVINEKNFHDDFVNLIGQVDSRYILFGTDDVVYYDSVDFGVIENTFGKFSKDIFGFSLRLSPLNLKEDSDQITKIDIGGETIYRLKWKKGRNSNARYPFELNTTVYKKELVAKIIKYVAREYPKLIKIFSKESLLVKILSSVTSMKDFLIAINTFHDPNTLEGFCYRWCKNHKSKVPSYLYFQKNCGSAIQVNRVNTTMENPVDGSNEHTVEVLNEKYIQGYRFDIDMIGKNKPVETHVGQDYFKLIKK
ncbi:MAG: hypothetical protein ABIK92_10420 [Pseudomonadota bacterium]